MWRDFAASFVYILQMKKIDVKEGVIYPLSLIPSLFCQVNESLLNSPQDSMITQSWSKSSLAVDAKVVGAMLFKFFEQRGTFGLS